MDLGSNWTFHDISQPSIACSTLCRARLFGGAAAGAPDVVDGGCNSKKGTLKQTGSDSDRSKVFEGEHV